MSGEAFKSVKGDFNVYKEKVVRSTAMVPGNIPVFNDKGEMIDSGKSITALPSEVTNEETVSLLTNAENWNEINHYAGPTIICQKSNDWYDDNAYHYHFITATKVIRILYANL